MGKLYDIEEKNSYTQRKSVDYKPGFKHYAIGKTGHPMTIDTSCNQLLFLRSGEIHVCCNEFTDKKMGKNECILIPKASEVSLSVARASHLLMFRFDSLQDICDHDTLLKLREVRERMNYTFSSVPVRYPLTTFIDLLNDFLLRNANCETIHEIKAKELCLILRAYYSEEEIVTLLYPLIDLSDFRSFVFKNYLKVKNVAELVSLSGMGRTSFDCTFRDSFGMSAHQWMLKQMAKHIQYKAMEAKISIRSLMAEYKFKSPTQFNRFCRQQFNCTPGELVAQSREKRHKISEII